MPSDYGNLDFIIFIVQLYNPPSPRLHCFYAQRLFESWTSLLLAPGGSKMIRPADKGQRNRSWFSQTNSPSKSVKKIIRRQTMAHWHRNLKLHNFLSHFFN